MEKNNLNKILFFHFTTVSTKNKKSRIKITDEKDAKCPVWEMFLMQIFNNDLQLIHFVQKAMDYSLSGNVSEQCLFILWGTGANG